MKKWLLLLYISLSNICDASFIIDNFNGKLGVADATSLNLNLGSNLHQLIVLLEDAELDFYSVDFVEKCDPSLAYTATNTTAHLPNDPPAPNQFELL